MKRTALALLLVFCWVAVPAQTKIAHINSEAIMQALPEAIDAQKSLDVLVAQWEAEVR
jgi:Skp family chaperone for outer membrane proteins